MTQSAEPIRLRGVTWNHSRGYLALAMGSVTRLGDLLGCELLRDFQDPATWFTERDRIKAILAQHLETGTTAHWLAILEPADIWCADVLDWKRLLEHDGFKVLGMAETVRRANGTTYQTTRCPIRIDGRRLYSEEGSPDLGGDTGRITREFVNESDSPP
jgi:crotonobetainyl-CoA:carnitine CoA-transferase CaiB-like acyl-CoA transferase